MLKLYKELMNNDSISNNSIMLVPKGTNETYFSFLSIVAEKLGKEIKSSDFVLFNLDDKSEREFFNKINFKSNKIYSTLEKPIYLMGNNKVNNDIEMQNAICNYIRNLQKNKGEEIPIFVVEAGMFNSIPRKELNEIVIDLNNKGYFFVFSLKKIFLENNLLNKHILIMGGIKEDKKISKILKNGNAEAQQKELICYEYYYLKDLRLQCNEINRMLHLVYKDIGYAPKYERIRERLLVNKIQDF